MNYWHLLRLTPVLFGVAAWWMFTRSDSIGASGEDRMSDAFVGGALLVLAAVTGIGVLVTL